MAKKKVNKSQAIRDYLSSNPGAKPAEISAALKKKGINVSAAFVSSIKSTSQKSATKRKPGRPKRAKTVRAKSKAQATTLSLDALLAAKSFAADAGGLDNARAALDALEKLAD